MACDLVLAAVAAAYRSALVVLGLNAAAQGMEHAGRQLGLAVLAQQRQHSNLDRRESRGAAEHGTDLALDLLSS